MVSQHVVSPTMRLFVFVAGATVVAGDVQEPSMGAVLRPLENIGCVCQHTKCGVGFAEGHRCECLHKAYSNGGVSVYGHNTEASSHWKRIMDDLSAEVSAGHPDAKVELAFAHFLRGYVASSASSPEHAEVWAAAQEDFREAIALDGRLGVAGCMIRQEQVYSSCMKSKGKPCKQKAKPPVTPTWIDTQRSHQGLGSTINSALATGWATSSRLRFGTWSHGCNRTDGAVCKWEDFFLQPSPAIVSIGELPAGNKKRKKKRECCVRAACVPFELLASHNSNKMKGTLKLADLRRLVHASLTLQPRVRKAVDGVKLLAGLSTQYAAFHIRRGDKVHGNIRCSKDSDTSTEVCTLGNPSLSEADIVQGSKYVEQLKKLPAAGIKQLFVATDDAAAVLEVQAAAPHLQVLSMPKSETKVPKDHAGYQQRSYNSLSSVEKFAEMVQLWAEIELLAEAKFFVGTFSSNIGRLVQMLRGQEENTAVSVDGDVFQQSAPAHEFFDLGAYNGDVWRTTV